MFEQYIIEHHIQKCILQVLVRTEFARYRDMRPEKTDSNLYAYHLKRLISSGYIKKTDAGYTLSNKGLRYVEYASSTSMKVRPQPKITTATLLKDANGRVLLTKRARQPYINYYGLPLGKVHYNRDGSILDAAIRELHEKTGVIYKDLSHVGDTYLKIHVDEVLVSDILVHVFSAECDKTVVINDSSMWIDKKDFDKISIIPGVKELVELTESSGRFFEEISV